MTKERLRPYTRRVRQSAAAATRVPPVSHEKIRKLEKEYRAARDKAERLREQRNGEIRKAVQDGAKQAELARETGLSRGRIAQIISG